MPSATSSGLSSSKRVLLVGGTGSWFHEIERCLLALRPGWVAQHALDVRQAESALNAEPWDCLVMHAEVSPTAPGLFELSQKWPRLFSVNLAEEAKRSDQGIAEQPGVGCEDPVLNAETVVRSLLVEDWTARATTKNLLSRITKLPTLPRLHLQVAKELQSPDGSLEMVSHLVRQDPVMAAKFLQVVNSAANGMAYTVTDPGEAVMFLGAVRTRALVLMAGVFSQFDDLRCPGFSAEDIWQHSLLVARLAQGVTLVQTEDPKMAEMAFTAGLLHDVGKLVLASNVPDMYATAHKLQQLKHIPESEAELAILSTSHSEIGGSFLGNWRLPLVIVEAVGWHHTPSQSSDHTFSVLTAVHCANVLAHETDTIKSGVGRTPHFDMMYLVRLGLVIRRNFWRDACGLPIRDEDGTLEDAARGHSDAKDN
jgi:HD-like signal output (HDOD) protein